jgi:DNA primase
MIPEDKVHEIIERTDIAALVGRSVELKRAGHSLKGLCPFHGERTPSFTVSPERRRFKCFGCGAGGDAITFVMRREGKGFAEATRTLAAECGVQLTEGQEDRQMRDRLVLRRVHALAARYYAQRLWDKKDGAPARAHLKGRGLDGEAAKTFGLGFAPAEWNGLAKQAVTAGMLEPALQAGLCVARKGGSGRTPARRESDGGAYDFFRGRLMIPVRNAEGATVAFGGRTLPLPGMPADERKFVNSRESLIYRKGELLFGIDLAKDAIRKSGQALLVEGYFDAIALHMAGLKNAVALCSASLTQEQIKLLRRFEAKEIVLILDGDEAGRRGVERAAGALLGGAMPTRVMLLPQGKDPDEHVVEVGAKRFQDEVAAAPELTEYLVDLALPQRHAASFEQKLKAIAELRPIVAQVGDGLERTLFIGALARGLGVSEDDLRRSLQGRSPSQSSGKGPQKSQLTSPSRTPTIREGEPAPQATTAPTKADRRLLTEELLLVAHLLHDPELARLPQSDELESLEDLGLRALACEVLQGIRDDHPADVGQLMAELSPALRSQLSGLLERVRAQAPRAHREEFIQKCALHQAHLERREEEHLQEQLRTLAKEIAVRRKSAPSDDAELRDLLEEHLRLTELKRSVAAVHRPGAARRGHASADAGSPPPGTGR